MHRLYLMFRMYVESDYRGCLYLISVQEDDVSPDNTELATFKCQTTRANDFYVLTCFNMRMKAGGKIVENIAD